MASGVSVENECETQFNELKMKHKYKYVIFKLSDDSKKIEVDCVSSHDKEGTDDKYVEFVGKLKGAKKDDKPDCRYAAYDYEYFDDKTKNTGNKIVFVTWAPDMASIKQKMLYTSSKKALEQKLVGVAKVMQCCDDDEIAEASMKEKCMT